ncbi:hypothetical protein K3495_g12909 [Podosphaera aphanis]|nr:hypothetical protein K3495_g12909 [Podosphaera aphanis]
MTTFKQGSLTKDTYLDWVDTVQGRATDSGVWKYIDPVGTIKHTEPKKPEPSDYKVTTTKYAELSDDEQAMFKEDNA